MRRSDYEARGKEALEKGDRAMKDRDYEKATAYYKSACDIIPNAPLAQSLYDRALHDFCDASNGDMQIQGQAINAQGERTHEVFTQNFPGVDRGQALSMFSIGSCHRAS